MDLLFKTSQPARASRFETGWLWFLFLASALLWCAFLNWGNIPFDFHDWAEINAPRVAFLGDAMKKGVLPLHMSDASALRNLTDRFMSIPDVLLSPQIVLLRWLPIGPFMLVNLLLLYAAGFWGLLRIRRQFQLSIFLFSVIFVIFNFNGHIVSHLGIGHYTWTGYFLLPWFFWLLLQLKPTDHLFMTDWRWVAKMAGLLLLIFLQGAFHQYLWCLLFLGIYGLGNWRSLWQIILGALFSGLLLLGRFLPVTLLFGQFDTEFRGGYPRPWQIIQALTIKQTPATSLPQLNFGSPLGYWEFDIYAGMIGTLILTLAFVVWLRPQLQSRRFSPWLAPMLVLALLSIHKAYYPLTLLPIPILNGERVTSRLLIMPLLTVLLVVLPQTQAWLAGQISIAWKRTAASFFLVFLFIDLTWQTLEWQVTQAYRAFPSTPTDLAIKVVANHPDPAYTQLILTGTLVALAAGCFLLFMALRQPATHPKPSH